MEQSSAESEEDQPTVICSQRDYKPTPFRITEYERVGQRILETEFAPLEVSVLDRGPVTTDPMFEVFDPERSERPPLVFHGGGNVSAEHAEPGASAEDQARLLEEIAEQKYNEGYLEGVEAGRADALEEIKTREQELAERLAKLNQTLSSHVAAFFQKLERSSMNLSLAVAKKLLITTSEAKPEYIYEVIREGLKAVGAAKPLRIRLSPQDHEFLEVIGPPPDLSTEELGIEYIADEAVRSGCLVETDFGDVDLTLERMWEQVKETLFEVTR